MTDQTVKKVDSAQSPPGRMGQGYPAAGTTVEMGRWEAG